MPDQVTFLMAFMLWIVTGFLVGWFFGIIMGTGKHGGFLGFVVLGMIGAVVSGLLFRLFGGALSNDWQVNVMVSVVGALVLMAIAEQGHRRRTAPKKHHIQHKYHH